MNNRGDEFENIHFTNRETECIAHLLKGKTIKATAHALGLSPRTVEFYLNNMKQKLGCNTKSKLVELLYNNDLCENTE